MTLMDRNQVVIAHIAVKRVPEEGHGIDPHQAGRTSGEEIQLLEEDEDDDTHTQGRHGQVVPFQLQCRDPDNEGQDGDGE
jgi:hypothetical protein